ncbi:ferrous iron transport protein A [Candidatus Berkelbacteria bacterium CG10_big_fil_rev_8_21_14_0_10_43_13]|uniref:Ferrous iron transport protein A n=1 Tax=Candidatus Berkelbacteria bacterium CG10_big_fil_rev_8_21_14_0_10_43_13 TaxID=1974514 RepID=A0A2H0W5W8_9BACT|nr:MAG: ferrous iron transport protein A [Candidatus Berkelbacteria bacterium CG10_big_fil_rev_8_21_14_0_10_43_13]
MTITLNKLELDSSAIIESIKTDQPTKERLESLGFLPGVRIFAVVKTPLGSSGVYLCLNSMIALREEVTALIEVRLEANNE